MPSWETVYRKGLLGFTLHCKVEHFFISLFTNIAQWWTSGKEIPFVHSYKISMYPTSTNSRTRDYYPISSILKKDTQVIRVYAGVMCSIYKYDSNDWGILSRLSKDHLASILGFFQVFLDHFEAILNNLSRGGGLVVNHSTDHASTEHASTERIFWRYFGFFWLFRPF